MKDEQQTREDRKYRFQSEYFFARYKNILLDDPAVSKDDRRVEHIILQIAQEGVNFDLPDALQDDLLGQTKEKLNKLWNEGGDKFEENESPA